MEETYEKFKKTLEENNQGHLLKFWPDLNDDEKRNLLAEIKEIDVPAINQFFKVSFE